MRAQPAPAKEKRNRLRGLFSIFGSSRIAKIKLTFNLLLNGAIWRLTRTKNNGKPVEISEIPGKFLF